MRKENTYNLRGISKYYPNQQINPVDERLTIQRMRKGAVNDIRLSQDTYAHSDFLSQEFHHGLKEYIRTSYGKRKIPTYIFDQHNHALFGWYEGLKEGKIAKGALLIHIDEHADAEKPDTKNFDSQNLQSVARYVANAQIYDFISPAIQDGLVGDVVWVRPLLANETIKTVDDTPRNISYTEVGMDHSFIDRIIHEEFSPEQVIVDLDIDYFRYLSEEPQVTVPVRDYQAYATLPLQQAQNEVFTNDIARTKALLSVAGVITIATSPGYIDQGNAISLIREILA